MSIEEWFEERQMLLVAEIFTAFCQNLLNPAARELMSQGRSKAVDEWAELLNGVATAETVSSGAEGCSAGQAKPDPNRLESLPNVRQPIVDDYSASEVNDLARRKKFYSSCSGIAYHDPKTLEGMLNILVMVVDSKFNVQEILRVFRGNEEPPQNFTAEGVYKESAGMVAGDQLTLERWGQALIDILCNGIYHDDIDVRMASYIYSELASKMLMEPGHFHCTMAIREGIMKLEDQITMRPVLRACGRGDKVDRSTVSKRLQTARYVQDTELWGRLWAAFFQAIEYGDMPTPAEMFIGSDRPGGGGVLVPCIQRLQMVKKTALGGDSDMMRFCGQALLDRHTIAYEWENCVRYHDSEGLAVLPRIALPLAAAAEKRKYMQVFMQMIENEECDAPARQIARWGHNTHCLESARGVATDALLEDSMGEMKPAIRISGMSLLEPLATNYRMLSAVRNSYRDSVEKMRFRTVRAHKVTRRVKQIVEVSRMLTRSGHCAYKRTVKASHKSGLYNQDLHDAAHESGAIGDAMDYETRNLVLTDADLKAMGFNNSTAGRFKVFRVESREEEEDGAILLLERIDDA
jgi:hypothetical protein